MNVLDAAYKVAHAYPGGTEALGPRAGINAAVLRNKVNPNTATHHLTLEEAVRLTDLTGDTAMLQAWAAHAGFALQRLDAQPESAASIVMRLLQVTARHGDLSSAYADALADNVVTPNECKHLGELVRQLQSAAVQLQAAVEASCKGRAH